MFNIWKLIYLIFLYYNNSCDHETINTNHAFIHYLLNCQGHWYDKKKTFNLVGVFEMIHVISADSEVLWIQIFNIGFKEHTIWFYINFHHVTLKLSVNLRTNTLQLTHDQHYKKGKYKSRQNCIWPSLTLGINNQIMKAHFCI